MHSFPFQIRTTFEDVRAHGELMGPTSNGAERSHDRCLGKALEIPYQKSVDGCIPLDRLSQCGDFGYVQVDDHFELVEELKTTKTGQLSFSVEEFQNLSTRALSGKSTHIVVYYVIDQLTAIFNSVIDFNDAVSCTTAWVSKTIDRQEKMLFDLFTYEQCKGNFLLRKSDLKIDK